MSRLEAFFINCHTLQDRLGLIELNKGLLVLPQKMHTDLYFGKFSFVSKLTPDCKISNLVSSLGLLSPDLLLLKEEKTFWLACVCPMVLNVSWSFCFQNLPWLGLSVLTCKLGFTEQKFSTHGVLWKISKGCTLSLLILVPCFRQINQCQLFTATAKINYDTNFALFSFSHPLMTNQCP